MPVVTVPTQRGGAGGSSDQLLGFIAESLKSVQESVTVGFRDVNQALSKLPDTYVPRREFDRYRDELSIDWQQAVSKRDRDFQDLCTEHEKDIEAVRKDISDNEARRVARGRYVITTLIALTSVILALAALVIAHF